MRKKGGEKSALNSTIIGVAASKDFLGVACAAADALVARPDGGGTDLW